MNKKTIKTAGLGALHEFTADAVYPRKPRRLRDQDVAETRSVDSQLHEFVDQAITPKKRRRLALVSQSRQGSQPTKLRATRAR